MLIPCSAPADVLAHPLSSAHFTPCPRARHERVDASKFVLSDADEQLLIHIPFVANIKLKTIRIISQNDESRCVDLVQDQTPAKTPTPNPPKNTLRNVRTRTCTHTHARTYTHTRTHTHTHAHTRIIPLSP